MSDSGSDASKTAMQIAASLAGEVYKDGVQPSIQTIGETLNGIFKAVGHYPRYWGMMSDISLEAKEEQFREKLQSKVDAIPQERRILPRPNILGPSIQALEYGIFEDHLSEMFTSLIAGSMDFEIANDVHPSFVEIIKQINSDEAKMLHGLHTFTSMFPICNVRKGTIRDGSFIHILEKFTLLSWKVGCSAPEKYREMIENLERLKLIEVSLGGFGSRSMADENAYDETIKELESRLGLKIDFDTSSFSIKVDQVLMDKGYIEMTAYGSQFARICVR
ncbi:DUF4393 domain-containing protein [Deinococcus humi]|uniref:DUF4393 domain-containing protein n=1 Tax=Deinococcus humi TaxID=662880 RepID=A0A7W8JSG0_9DEIO|nr:DUF4393 domain-containing protein [Deinococcus humi]MBB5360941.1 hypothetical protein [Deinococcus humi]GGO17692.1 hypothetical protein GCM10008949_00110 [Deinococcus humi]